MTRRKTKYVNVRTANFPSDPYGYDMGDKEANIAVHTMVLLIMSQIHMGTITRDELDKQVRLGLAYVVTGGWPQVLTVGPLARIQAALNMYLPKDWAPLPLLNEWGM